MVYFGRGESGMLCCTSKLAHRIRDVFLHSFLELSSYTIMGAGGRSEGVGSIDEPDSSAWLSVWGVSVCRFGFSTLPASKRSKFNIAIALGNTYIRKL